MEGSTAQGGATQAVVGNPIRCPYCGAPIKISPDEMVSFCPYCGSPVTLRPEIVQGTSYIVKVLDRDKLERRLIKQIRKIDSRARPESLELLYLPVYLYVAQVTAKAVVEVGKVEVVKRRQTRVTVEKKYIRDLDYTRVVPVAVIGRVNDFPGEDVILKFIEETFKYNDMNFPPGTVLNTNTVKDFKEYKILGLQKNPVVAEQEAKVRAENLVSPKNEKGIIPTDEKLKRVLFYEGSVVTMPKGLFFFPVAIYHWMDRDGRRYTAVAEALTGKILYTTKPIPTSLKYGGMAISALSPLIFNLLYKPLGLLMSFIIGAVFAVGGMLTKERGEVVWKKY